MFSWEEGDRFSFEDSDRFEEDSLCSWISEPESLCNNWRGWKKLSNGTGNNSNSNVSSQHSQGQCNSSSGNFSNLLEDGEKEVPTLVELAARQVGFHIPFEVVERVYPPVPEQLQLRIAVWSFPENEEDIRLYSCLANGSADEFQRGEVLYRAKAVKVPLQIGFHLSSTVVTPQALSIPKGSYNVAITFDRKRITSCNCTCSSTASWCAHVVAMCLHRIHLPNQVCLRAPVSESLSRLSKVQLRKFAQYLIYEQPQQILPTAQKLLDELLTCQESPINTAPGAPDPTAGASVTEQTTWCLDEANLHENIHKILIKFCVPSPIVFSDVNYLSTTAPPAAAEWSSLLRPLRGREPEGMWNLLSIVREMFRRHDRNAIPLLEILTEECLACDQILIWWFNTKVSLLNSLSNIHPSRNNNVNSNTHASQHACSSLCEEIVILWRLSALNPALSPQDRSSLYKQFKTWHLKIIEKVCKGRGGMNSNISSVAGGGSVAVTTSSNSVKKSEIEVFPGFKPALEACLMDWKSYPICGVTYDESASAKWYYNPVTHARSFIEPCRDISSSPVVLTCDPHHSYSSYPPISKRGRSVEIGQSPSSPHGSSYLNPCPVFNSNDVSSVFVADSSEFRNDNVAVLNQSFYANRDGNRSSVSSEGFCENECSDLGVSPSVGADNKLNVVITIDAATNRANNLDDSVAISGNYSGNQNSSSSNNNISIQPSLKRENSKSSAVDELDSDWSSCAADGNQKITKSESKAENGTSVTYQGENGDGGSEERSPNSSDEQYQVYYYDTQTKLSPAGQASQSNDNSYVFSSIKKLEDPIEILYARAEALHAHGHTQEACKLAVKLAEEMLINPPDLLTDVPPQTVKGKRNKRLTAANTASHQISCLASATLAKAAFLCTVLADNAEHHNLAFKVGMFGLEMLRPPASTKTLEVKLSNQECDLVILLKKIPLGPEELKAITERAIQLKEGTLRSRGEALLPLVLASFIFDSLCASASNNKNGTNQSKSNNVKNLGFEAAVAALGLKANISEAEHPLLCEGTRRQRGELAITLLVHYKDDQEKLSQIMDKLLDKDVHCMYKSSPGGASQNGGQVGSVSSAQSSSNVNGGSSKATPVNSGNTTATNTPTSTDNGNSLAKKLDNLDLNGGGGGNVRNGTPAVDKHVNSSNATANANKATASKSSRYNSLRCNEDRDLSSSPTWEEDYKAWEAKFRCTNFKTHKKHSEGMASIDSSAPETTSSDNSPTMVRRHGWTKPVGSGSDSGSSGKSSDSFGSSSSGTGGAGAGAVIDKSPNSRLKVRENESPSPVCGPTTTRYMASGSFSLGDVSRPFVTNIKNSRFKSKKAYPSIPNQPSEASAHFMFELAKTVLTKAGGNSSTSLFTQPSTSQNHRGPHRALHMCAFQIGLYALGLHNCVSPNWLSRTYSSQVSWITGQAMEIGSAAITFLINTWEGHLTPPEVASLADKASRGRDPNMVRAAAELALSCLPHAHALNPNEVQRALIQCKEQNDLMLERACLAVECAAKGGGVYPEVLFDVARRWFELYEQSNQGDDTNVSTAAAEMLDHQCAAAIAAVVSIDASNATFTSFSGDLAARLPLISHIGAHQHMLPPPPNIAYPALAPIHPPSPMPYPVVSATAGPYGYIHPGIPPTGPPIFTTQGSIHTVPTPFHPAYLSQPAHGTAHHPPSYPYPANIPMAIPTTSYYTLATSCNSPQLPPRCMASLPTPLYAAPMRQLAPTQLAAQIAQPTNQVRPNCQQACTAPPINQTQLNYLLAAYRVGMLAMETLARRVHDDRPQAKYARNPPYGEDVKWLLNIAEKLGTSYLQQFCICTVNSVASPFVLQEIAMEAAHYLSRNSPAAVVQHLRSPVLTPLVQKCQQMYMQCTHLKMFHITAANYEEFVGIIRSARTAFQMTPGGLVQFNELLQSLRRSKSCKKELWQRIANALAVGAV